MTPCKKLLLVAALWPLVAGALFAQKNALGLQAGPFLSTAKADEVHYDFSWKTGFSAGLFYRFRLTDQLSLQPEFSYTQRSVRGIYSFEDYFFLDSTVVLNLKADQNILELGGVFHEQIGAGKIKAFIDAGMLTGFLTNQRISYTRNGQHYLTTRFTHNDIDLVLGSGATFPLSEHLTLALGLRYTLSLNYQSISPLKPSEIGSRHHRLMLQLGLIRSI